MATRGNYVDAVALLIARALERDGAYGEPIWSLDYAHEVNRAGWTFELSAPMDNWLRYEGIVLSEVELRQAWDRAQSLLEARGR